MRDLNDRELMQAIRAANLSGDTIRLTCDSGPYEVTTPTHVAGLLAQAIVRKFCEVNGIAPRGVGAARPVNDLDPGDCPELNLSNYDADDVAELNGWAVQADACIERLTRERNEFHTQAQHAQAEIREAHAAMDAAGFPRLQPSTFPYSLTGRVRAGTNGVEGKSK